MNSHPFGENVNDRLKMGPSANEIYQELEDKMYEILPNMERKQEDPLDKYFKQVNTTEMSRNGLESNLNMQDTVLSSFDKSEMNLN